jgi:hypothetical protein
MGWCRYDVAMKSATDTNEWQDVAQRLAGRCSAHGAQEMLQELTLLAWMSCSRARKGEYLHGLQHLGAAVDSLLRMLKRLAPADGFARVCDVAPRRRLHAVVPAVAHELLAIMLGTVDSPEVRLLEIAERHLRPRLPELEWAEVHAVCARMRPQAGDTVLRMG